MKGPKVVVLGAGSYFFGKPVIYNMVTSPVLREGVLALVDPDPDVLETMTALAKRAAAEAKAPLRIESAADRRKVLAGADFVVLSFSFRNTWYRGLDTRIAAKYGVKMCSSDTIGPGGIFRALRELPEVLRIASDVRELCPQAWLINFVNPTSTLGIGLKRYAPDVKSFALCDGNHMPYVRAKYLQWLGLLDEKTLVPPPEMDAKFELVITGVNHCTWILRCAYEGKDCLPRLREYVARQARAEFETRPTEKSKPRLGFNYALRLFDLYGYFPTAYTHTKEYVPFFQGWGVTPVDPEPITCFDAYTRREEMDEAWAATKRLADGTTPIAEFFASGRGDHATDIIESMWGDLGKDFYINTTNGGAVTNLPPEAVLELRCKLDLQNGPVPYPVGEMPLGLRGLSMQVIDTHELTAQAAVTCDRKILMRALATDPIVNNLGDAKNIMEELLEAEREHLDPRWY